MTPDEWECLVRAEGVIARMPFEFSATRAAEALHRAAMTTPAEAHRIILAAGALDIAAVLLSAGHTLRSTGHFQAAQMVEACAAVMRTWERRDEPRNSKRHSGGAA